MRFGPHSASLSYLPESRNGQLLNLSIEEACRGQLPDFNQQLKKVARDVAMLTPEWLPDSCDCVGSSGESRVGSSPAAEPFRSTDLESIKKKDVAELVRKAPGEGRAYTSTTSATRRELRPSIAPLSDLADQLVRFDGYVDQGKAYQAISASALAENARQVIRLTCDPSYARRYKRHVR